MDGEKTFTIGTSTIPGGVILPAILPELIKRRPDFSIKLDISNSFETFQKVRDGEMEVGIIGTRYGSEEVEFRPFIQGDELVMIAPKDHPLANHERIALDNLSGQNFVSREQGSGTRTTYEEAFHRAGLSLNYPDGPGLNVVVEIGNTDGVIQAVEAGTGLAVVSRIAAEEAVCCGTIAVLNLPFEIQRNFYLIFPKGKELSPIAREVVSLLEELVK